MRLPGLQDWTRNEKAAEAILEDKYKQEPNKKPWEKKIIKLLSLLTVLAVIGYALWDKFF